jgi:tetratricopeptide (TPR) repeat protein
VSDLSGRILTQEEMEALVSASDDPPPGNYLLWAAMGLVLGVLAVVVVALWTPEDNPYQEVRSPSPPQVAAARTAMERGEFSQALDLLGRAAAERPPMDPRRLGRLRAEALLGRAALVVESRPGLALADVRSALALAPVWPQAYLGAGKLFLRLERPAEAYRLFDQATGLEPGNDVAWYNRGFALLRMERYGQAAKSFRRVIALGSAFAADAYVNLAVSQAHAGRAEEAVQSLEKALAINPNHELARDHLAVLRQREQPAP